MMNSLLGGRYQLGQMIGTGGMADVYIAQDQRLSREVAVKILRSDEFTVMEPLAQQISQILQSIPGAEDIKVEQTSGLPVLSVVIDRAAIARYGLNISDVQDVVAIAMGGREAGIVFEGDRRFPLIVRLPDAVRADLETLKRLPVPLPLQGGLNNQAAFLPLGEIARIEMTEGQNQVSRQNGKRLVVVQTNVRDRDIGSFVNQAKARLEAEIKLPAGYWLDWGGQFENLVKAKQRLLITVPLCFAMIFFLLFSAFKTFRHALLIFSGIPFASVS